MTGKLETIEGFEYKFMVYCRSIGKLVDLSFCLEGGPMKAKNECRYFIGIEKDEAGIPVALNHNLPTTEKIAKTIIKEH